MGTRFVVSLLSLLALSVAATGATFTLVELPATGTDAAIGIDSAKTYTHAFDFGSNAPVTINGVALEQGPTAAITAAYTNTSRQGYGYTITDTRAAINVAVHAGNDPSPYADGDSAEMLRDMIYHSASTTIGAGVELTLSDLVPGTTYSTRFYYRPWGGVNTERTITVQADGESDGVFSDPIDFEWDAAGAHYLDYTFTADDTDVTFQFLTNDNNNGVHFYGVTNEMLETNLATAPVPADGAVDVSRDTLLSWTAGQSAATHDVYLGTSFDDVSAATAATPLGVLVGQGLSDAGFDPGRLELGQTYYWRVDEVNGAPDNTVFTGNVWSFTVEPYSYIAQNVIATTSGISESGPENAVNGSGLDADGQHSNESSDMWLAVPDGDVPLWIQFEFDRVLRLDTMRVWNYNSQFEAILGFGIKDATIEYSVDGAEWAVLADVVLDQATGNSALAMTTEVDLDGIAARYVRLTVNSGWGAMGTPKYGLSEVQFTHVPAFARQPHPASGAADQSPALTLSWRPGREAAQHNLYLDTDEQAVIDGAASAIAVDEPEYEAALELGQTYYWKVEEVNDAEEPAVWTSAVWNFSVAESIVVEDFETYDDNENVIYETWIDGWINEALGGSTVGYFDAPFTETTLAHNGDESMPFAYDNTGDFSLSETERSFEDSQNWSQYGIQSLSLHFMGDPANTTGQLYVKVNGTKVLYDGSSEDLKIAAWIPWTIDLTALNVQNVNTLAIGVEGAGAAGTLFIDDVRLWPYAGETVEPVLPDEASLVAYYPLDGDASDAAGNHDGTISGTPDFMEGYQGQAIDLASNATVPQYVSVPYSEDFALNSFTVAAWINVNDLDALRAILGTRFNSDNTFDLKVEATRVHGDIGDGSVWLNTSVDIDAAHGGVVSIGDWHHIAYAIDDAADTADLYLDGVLATTVTFSGTPLLMKADQELRIGNASGTEYMNGRIDEVRIYNRALSPAEVAGLVGRPGPIYTAF